MSTSVTQPTLGLVGWARWAWRQLTSMKTALFLLLLLAIGAVPGSMFPQRSLDPSRTADWIQRHPDAGPILDAGIPVVTMGMRPGVPDPRGVLRLARHLARERPDVVQTWMDHSNLIAGVAAALASCPKVVWGVHHSDHVRGLAHADPVPGGGQPRSGAQSPDSGADHHRPRHDDRA